MASGVFDAFWLLLCLHALADYALQSDSMARGKNRNIKPDPKSIPPGQAPVDVWPYWLASHALIHGLAVSVVVGNALGLAEFVSHLAIDWCKCNNRTTIHQDQALHIACKVVWVAIWWAWS